MPPRRVRALALAAALLPFAAWTAFRLLGAEAGWPAVQLMAFTPYVAAASAVPLLAALASRLWWHAGVAAVLAAVLAGCVLPRAVPGGGAPVGGTRPGPQLRVLTANLYVGAADAAGLVRQVRSGHVDLLAVQELTPSEVARLDAAGLATLLPHRAVAARPGSGGSGLFSRYPLTGAAARTLPQGHLQASATLSVPGAAPLDVESAHPCAPSDDATARGWARDIVREPAATPAGPVRLLLGDFNSTLDHEGLRALLATGYRDAAATVGDGLAPTWPFSADDDHRHGVRIPPVTLDHVLADPRIGVTDAAVHPITGSDHRAVLATLVLPAT